MTITEEVELKRVEPGHTEVDSRTLLPDRDRLYRDMLDTQDASVTENRTFALLVIEVTGLEFVLRTFGPDERDSVVKEIGARIQGVMVGGNRSIILPRTVLL